MKKSQELKNEFFHLEIESRRGILRINDQRCGMNIILE